jgi:hypothetical protein
MILSELSYCLHNGYLSERDTAAQRWHLRGFAWELIRERTQAG